MKVFKAIGNFFKKVSFSVVKFFVLTYREMKKVRWPSREKMKEASKIVFTFLLFAGIYVVFSDFLIARLLKWIKY